jgi:cell division protein FtsQ
MHIVRKGETRGRRNARFNKQIFIGLLLVLTLLVGGFTFIHSSYFTVGSIEVEGNKYLSKAEIYQIANINPRINIFKIDSGAVRKRLMQDLRVQDVTVERKFPTTIVLHIRERRTVAFIPTNYGFVQVDKQGYVLAALRTIKAMGLPMITGTKLINAKVGDQVDGSLHTILDMLGELDEETLNAVSEINISNPNGIIGYTVDAIPVKIGNGQRPQEKAKLLNMVLQDIRQQKLAVEYIDVAYGTPVIKFKR